jgi:hypothetical protein
MTLSSDPAAVVQRQLDAYNARDVDALLATYAEDAQMFEHPSKLLATGAVALRERFVARFHKRVSPHWPSDRGWGSGR